MKLTYALVFLSAVFSTNIWAYCQTPHDLPEYEVIDGDYIWPAGPWLEHKKLYIKGNVTLKPNSVVWDSDIYATGTIKVKNKAYVRGGLYSESDIDVHWRVNRQGALCPNMTPADYSYCGNPPDVRNYKLYPMNFSVYENKTLPDAGKSENIYVTGNVSLGANSRYNGNIYATGHIYIDNNAVVTGDVYSEDNIYLRYSSSRINGKRCENGDPIAAPLPPTLDLPVDELTGQCTAVFKDAAQSFDSAGTLTMNGRSKIVDAVHLFDFKNVNKYISSASCGNFKCAVTGKQSSPLSSFTIPTITGPSIYINSWRWGADDVIVGAQNDDINNGQYKGRMFGYVEVGSWGNSADQYSITFLKQDDPLAQIYQIDHLIINPTGVAKFHPGVYAIRDLSIASGAHIEVIGEGKVYLFVENSVSFPGRITSQSNQLVLASNGNVNFWSNADFPGSVYAAGNVELNSYASIRGRVAAKNLTMNANSKIENNLSCSPPGEDYVFDFSSSNDALTCEPHSVTIQVTLDDKPVTDYSGVINLTTSSATGVWHKRNYDGSWITLGGTDNGQASYQFISSDQGIVELGLFNQRAGDLTVTATLGALSKTSEPISFRPFQLRSEISCLSKDGDGNCFTVANRPFALKLTAVGKDQTSDVCQVISGYKGNKELKFWSSYEKPKVTAETAVAIGNSISEISAIAKSKLDAKAQSVAFSAGVANLWVNYPDAGKIQIHARDEQGIGAPPGTNSDDLQGSVLTVVNPLKLTLGSTTKHLRNPETKRSDREDAWIRASVPDYTKALDVDTFDITAKAIIDCTSSGVVANCGKKKEAPSFANTIELAYLAKDGRTGTLDYNNQNPEENHSAFFVQMTGGKFKYADLAYNEVGNLKLTVSSNDYLGIEGNDITHSDVKVTKRFYPDYLAYGGYSATPACETGAFTYVGQQAIKVNYTLQAYAQSAENAAKVVTKNYDNKNLKYPVATDFAHFVYDQKTLELTARLLANDYYATGKWELGVYNAETLLGLDKGKSIDGPFFTADNVVKYFVKLTGAYGEKIQNDGKSPCTDDKCVLGNLGDLAYGRLLAGNSHGSEFQPIRTTVQATYYDGSHFVPMPRDVCTAISNPQASVVKDPKALKSSLSILNNKLINGKSYFDFSAPGSRGNLDYFIDLHTAAPWLLDSGNAVACSGVLGADKNCISGKVNFGLFRGNDRIIHRLQTFN